jgi:hypothetical protein
LLLGFTFHVEVPNKARALTALFCDRFFQQAALLCIHFLTVDRRRSPASSSSGAVLRNVEVTEKCREVLVRALFAAP